MRTNRDCRTIRHMLVLGTALSGSWVATGLQPALAAQISGPPPSGVSVSGKSSDLTVSVSNNAVIGWNNLDIDRGNSVDFVDGRIIGHGGALAVLNRDNSGHQTSINGTLSSDPNIAVWIYNPSGILIGSHAHLNTGSLVLTTLNPDNNDFKANANPNSYKLTDPGVATKGIMVNDGASISVSGGSRGLILVSPVINATGSFDATGKRPDIFHPKAADQDVAFVTANAATLSYSAGSPVSVQIDKGTNLSQMNIVGGTIQGRNIYFAVASQSGINNVLLQVSADVTSAAQSGSGIVLAAGTSASNVSLAGGAATSGTVGLQTLVQSDHKLATQNSDVGILVSGNGAVTLNEDMDSAGDIQVSATNKATIVGTVTAQRNYSVSAGGVELGGTQTAGGTLSVASMNGALTGDAGLSLQSGANGAGGALTLRTTGATGGNIALASDSTLLAGNSGNANADVQIGVAVAGNDIALGDITARSLLGSVGSGSFGNTLAITHALTLGDVDTASSLKLSAGTLTTGKLSSKNGINLQSTTSTQAAALYAGGDVILNGGHGSVAVTGDVQAGGQYMITSGTVALGTTSSTTHQLANGAVTINAGGGGIRGLGALTLMSNADDNGTEALTLAIIDASSNASIDFDTSSHLVAGANRESDLIVRSGMADGLVALGGVSANSLLGAVGTAVPEQGISRTGALRFGNLTVTRPLNLSGGSITIGALRSGGGISLDATSGALTVASISSVGAVRLLGSGATNIAGQLKAGGDVSIDRGGALTLGSLQADGNVTLGGATGLTTITLMGKASSGGSFTARSTGLQHWDDVSSGGALSLTDTGVTPGGITAGMLVSGGTTAIASTGDLLATSIDSANGITLSGTGATTINGTIKARDASDGDLTINRDGAIVLGGINPARNLVIGSSVGPASLTVNGDTLVGGSVLVDTAGAQRWAGSISAGGALSLAPAAGTLQVTGPITSTGAVTLASMDALTVGGKVQAGGAVAINGTTVDLGDVATNSGNIGVTATQGLSAGTVNASGTTTLTSALGLQATSVKGGTGVALTAKGGDLEVDGAIDGGTGAVLATASGTADLEHSVTAGGNYQVSGASVTLGGVQSAGGSVSVTATAGGITGVTGLALTANSAGTGTGGLALSATGGSIALANNSSLNGGSGQSDVSITGDTGDMVLGNINARTLSINGGEQLAGGFTAGNLSLASGLTLLAGAPGIHLGDVTIDAGNLSLGSQGGVQIGDVTTLGGTTQLTGASVNFGSINAAGVTLTANGTATGSGKVSGGAITAAGPVQVSALTGDGTVTLGPIVTTGADGSLVLNAVGQVLLGKVNVSGTADIATVTNPADVLFENGLTAGGTIHISSTHDVRADTITSINGDLFINAPDGSVEGFTPGFGLNPVVGPGHTYSLNVGNDIHLGVVTGGPISLTADSITAISIDAGSFDVMLHASSGDLSIDHDVRGANIDLGATGMTSIGGNIIASGAVALSGDKGVFFNNISGTSVSIASMGGISGKSITSPGAIGLSGTTLALNSIEAGGDATVSTQDGDLAVSGDIDGNAVKLTSAKSIDVGGTITTASTATLSGGTGVTFAAINGPAVSITSGGAITGQSVKATGDASLSGASLALANLNAGGTATLAATNGDLDVSGDIGGGTLSLSSTGTTKVGGTVTASKAATLSGDKAVTFAAINGPAVSITSGGTITGQSVKAAGDASLTGASLALASLSAGTATLAATNGDLDVSGDIDGGTLTLGATGAISVGGTVTASNSATLSGDKSVTFATINGPSVSVTSGGAIAGQSVKATGNASLTGASLTLVDLSADTATLAATKGDLNVSGNIDGGTLSLSSTGTTKIGGTVTASKAATLSGDKGVTFAAINGPAVSVTSGGAIAGKSIESTGDVAVQGATVALTSLDASGGASLTSTGGDLSLGDATTGSDLVVSADGVATVSGDVSAGGNYNVRGASLALGGNGKTQQAGGAMLLTSTSGAIQAASGTTLIANAGGATGNAMLIDSAGGIDLSGATLDSTGGNLGLQAGSGQAVSLGTVKAGLIGGLTAAADGSQSVSGTFTHNGNFTAGTVTATGMSVSLTAGDMTLGDVTTSGALDLTTAQGGITTGAVHAGTLSMDAGGALTGSGYAIGGGGANLTGGSITLTSLSTTGGDLTATTRTGDLAIKTISAAGNATLQGAGTVKLDQASAAALSIKTTGDLGGLSGSGALLTANSGDLNIDAGGAVQLNGAKATTGAVTIVGNSVAATGGITAGKALAIDAKASLTMQDAQAGAGLTLQSGDTLNAGTLTATGDASITGGKDVTLTGLKAGGALTLTSAGNARLGSGSAGGAALIDAGGTATLGALSAGPTLTIRAADADITGTQSAATVAFENRNGDTTAMNLGDGAGSGGFSLSSAEIGLVKADTLVFRQGAGDVQIGTLAFTADAGRKAVDVLGTGNMTITGTVSGSGSGRLFQFGGSDSSDSASANAIWVRATPTAGGRLLFGDANLDLRGDRIAVGLSDGFVDSLQDASLDTVIASFVGNANSSLYNAALGGGGYDAAATTIVSANSMTVHYGQYALFQNTGPARTSSGVVLGGTAGAPISHALVLDTMPGNNAFALFGTLNGIGDTSASLLGGDVISLGNADLSNTRINGCLAGSGSGCLAAIIIQPTLQVFQTSQEDVFGSAGDLSVPFDPLIGGTNEELLTGLAALAPRDPGDAARRGGTTE